MKDFPRELMHGSGRMMTLDLKRLLLAFKAVVTRDQVGEWIDELGLVLEDAPDGEPESKPVALGPVNHTDRHFWVRSQTGRPISQELTETLQDKLADALAWIGPVYRVGQTDGRGNLLCPLPNVLVINSTHTLLESSGVSSSGTCSNTD